MLLAFKPDCWILLLTLYHTILYYPTVYYAIFCYNIVYYIILYHTISYYNIPSDSLSYYTIPYYNLPKSNTSLLDPFDCEAAGLAEKHLRGASAALASAKKCRLSPKLIILVVSFKKVLWWEQASSGGWGWY